jgi:hypothetical protein
MGSMLACQSAGMLSPMYETGVGKEDVMHVVTVLIVHQGAMPFDAEGGPEPAAPRCMPASPQAHLPCAGRGCPDAWRVDAHQDQPGST